MRRRRSGFFITFEGGEGLGKSTQAKLLAEHLAGGTVLTKEPGGTAIGAILRKILLEYKGKLARPAELFLLLADRAQHYKEVLKPAIQAGEVVVCARYWDSTLAYQGAGRGWSRSLLLRLHHATTGMLVPDLTFVLYGTPHRQMDSNDRFESEDAAFHARIAQEFERLPSVHHRYVPVNANRPVEVIQAEILAVVRDRMSHRTTQS